MASHDDGVSRLSGLKAEVLEHLRSERYGSAFARVLSSSDSDLLAWTCSQIRAEELFSISPLPLGQEIILSLAQQLGCDLHRDTLTKIPWIREAALSLNTSDPDLQPHIRQVLSSLEEVLAHVVDSTEGALKTEVRICCRVLRTVLRK